MYDRIVSVDVVVHLDIKVKDDTIFDEDIVDHVVSECNYNFYMSDEHCEIIDSEIIDKKV